MMRVTQIANPDTAAEGRCNGIPYTTDTYSIDGCAIHFWLGRSNTGERLKPALNKAMNARDIVKATWSFGEPSGFWANQDIE